MDKCDKEFADRMNTQIRRINNYIEQILYYVRSENAEKDYIINESKLSKIISAVALKNNADRNIFHLSVAENSCHKEECE